MPTPLPHTPRLIIRELLPSDAPLLHAYSREDDARRELPDEVLSSAEEARELIIELRGNYPSTYPLVYAIALPDDTLIGHLSLSEIDEGIEVGYAVAEGYQRQGYAREALAAFVGWAKDGLGLQAIYAVIKPGNVPSRRVVEAAGFTLVERCERKAWGEMQTMELYVL